MKLLKNFNSLPLSAKIGVILVALIALYGLWGPIASEAAYDANGDLIQGVREFGVLKWLSVHETKQGTTDLSWSLFALGGNIILTAILVLGVMRFVEWLQRFHNRSTERTNTT